MKKVGQFFFTFVPFLLVMAIQFLAMFFLMGVSALIEGSWYTTSGNDSFIAIFDDFTYLWSSQNFNTGVMLVYSLLTTAIFGIWYYARYDGDYLPAPKTVFHPLTFLGILMLVPGMQYLCTYIVNLVAAIFPQWLETYMELLEAAGLDETITFGMLIYSVLLAPVCEELVFRGITMRQAKKFLPFWAANIFQAFLFGAFHMNMMQGVYTFCVGLVLGIICEKSGSIYNAIFYHMLFNFWGTVLSQYLYIGESDFAFFFWFIFALAMTLGGLLVFAAGTRRARKHSMEAASSEYQ
ncbi:MAG: CPBP family intramembrane metalloprotease [Roseburia sp.]|nr:CPBP family intramembrane metalloprotease [Roseburia sp.]